MRGDRELFQPPPHAEPVVGLAQREQVGIALPLLGRGRGAGILALGHAGHARFHALPEQRVAGEE